MNQHYAHHLSFSGSGFTRAAEFPRCSEPAKRSCYTAVTEWRLGERQRKCRLHKRTNWLLRPSIAGRISKRALPQKSGKYPIQQFQAYLSATRRYAELTQSDALIHKSVATAVHGLVDFLSAERKRVPNDVLSNAERLECLLFRGYDPHFESDEPPGL